MQFNLFLMRRRFGESAGKAIAIDAGYISKSGKKTPCIGKFWSGCASAVKRGLEILGIGIVDIDSRDCYDAACGTDTGQGLSNTYMLKRISSKSGMKPNRALNAKLIKELFGIVAEAA